MQTTNEEKKTQQVPWLQSRQQWDERWGDIVTRAKNWRTAFVLAMVLACLQALALIVEMKRSHVVPFVVAVNDLHQVVAAGLATETTATDPMVLQAQLKTYVENARSITSDQQVLHDRLSAAFGSTVAASPAYALLQEYYRADDPFAKAADGTVQIEVHNITAISSTSYEINWTEEKRDKAGVAIGKEQWKGVFGVVVSPPKDKDAAWANPLGVYVNAITWSKSV
jgi:type IV secretory pathway TrbF-like protein